MSGNIFEVFMSYNSVDKIIVSEINRLLKEQGIRTWFDEDQVGPGDSVLQKIGEGIARSHSCLAFVGKSGIGPWEIEEIKAALSRQIKGTDYKVVPILLPDAPTKPELPIFVQDKRWIDMRKNQISGIRDILSAVRGNPRIPFLHSPLTFDVGTTKYPEGLPTRFSANMENIVGLLIGESLYSRKDVFVRELIQNAFDACERRKSDVYGHVPEITVTIDENSGTFQITDNGEGMNSTLLKERFAIIGKSIRDEKRIQDRILTTDDDALFLIAKFGIGFITAFIGAERIFISTKCENDQQINFSIFGIDAPFEFTPESNCDRSPHDIGTTVKLVLQKEYRRDGATFVDLVKAVRRYVRHCPYVKVIHAGQPIALSNSWNTESCEYVRAERVSRNIQMHIGVNKNGGIFTISNGGFFVCDNHEAILPYYLPTWLVGEINFRPGTVELNLARDSIVDNDLSEKVRGTLHEAFRGYLVNYLKDYVYGSIENKPSDFDHVKNLMFYYYSDLLGKTRESSPPLLDKQEVYNILMDLIFLPFGPKKENLPLREIVRRLRERGNEIAYTYYLTSRYDQLPIIIKSLQARFDLVFEYHNIKVSTYGLRGETKTLDTRAIITSILKDNGISLTTLDSHPIEKIDGLVYGNQDLPKRLRDELELVKGKSKLFFLTIPNGELSFRRSDTVYINAAHAGFSDLTAKLSNLPKEILRAYLLGLTQQQIGDL